jgi:hypothetical protein
MNRTEQTPVEQRMETVAARARQDRAPAIDVAQAVVRRLRHARGAYAPERPMMWMTAGAVAVAAVVLVFSMPYVDAALDPLTLFLEEAAASAI